MEAPVDAGVLVSKQIQNPESVDIKSPFNSFGIRNLNTDKQNEKSYYS